MHIYLDESGSLGVGDGDYFIVASFTVNDTKKVVKAFKRLQHAKFPKKLQVKPEVKFSDSINDALRIKMLEELVQQDIRIFYTYLKKEHIPQIYFKKGKVHETGLLYTEIVRSTLSLYMPVTSQEFIVIRDRRTLKGVSVEQFNETLATSLLPQLPAKINLQVQAVDSTSNVHIQIADWLCGALARFYEKKPMGKEFYDILKGNIVQEKELFSDYWTKHWEK